MARCRMVAAAVLVALVTASPALGQVGHDPSRSPFRDITARQTVSLSVGRFGGNTAVAGVGWRPGLSLGARFDTRLGGALDFYVSAASVASSRLRIDTENPDTVARVSGPVDRTLLLLDLGMVLNLTGAKTWRGFAPFVGFGAGFVLPATSERDPGGYHAGSNFALVPQIGTRFFVSRRLALRFEARDHLFRYEWPSKYYLPTDPDDNYLPPILDQTVKETQWTHNLTLSAGITWAFTF